MLKHNSLNKKHKKDNSNTDNISTSRKNSSPSSLDQNDTLLGFK